MQPREKETATEERLINDSLKPPLDWYTAIGTNDRGILIVHYSDEFLARDNGEMNRHLGNWHHLGCVLNVREPSKRDPEMVRRVGEAAEYIKRETGFSVEELAMRKSELLETLYGKREASIEVILVD